MCNIASDILDKLETTLDEFEKQDRAFTGYDLTCETREREGIKLRHNDIRGEIHSIPKLVDLIDFGDYQKIQIQAPNGGSVILYCPNGYDPNSYRFRQAQTHHQPKPAQPATPPTITAPTPTPAPSLALTSDGDSDGTLPDSGGQLTDGKYATDYRNRLFIQTRFLREAGLGAGDPAYVTATTNKITIRKSPPTTAHDTQVVERNGDMRLSSKALRKAGLDGTKFEIENSDDGGETVIEITPA